MKHHIIIFSFLCLLFAGCIKKEDFGFGTGDRVILNASVKGVSVTRSTDWSFENVVNHLDVFIFQKNTGEKLHYERTLVSENERSISKVLSVKKSDLRDKGDLNICVVANSSYTQDDLKDINSSSSLANKVESTSYINITGYSGFRDASGNSIAPETFLMTGQTEVNNLGNTSIEEDYNFDIELERAAAKVEIRFKRSENSQYIHSFGKPVNYQLKDSETPLNNIVLNYGTFDTDNDNVYTNNECSYEDARYYLRNLPYKTFYYSNEPPNDNKRKTNAITNAGYLSYNKTLSNIQNEEQIDEIIVVAYLYSCKWEQVSAFENAPFLIVNIPAVVYNNISNEESSGTYLDLNYYEIPLRIAASNKEDLKIERNHYYKINAIVDAPGSQTPLEPHQLTPVDFNVYPWNESSIDVGYNSGNNQQEVKYLSLSTNDIEMRNVSESAEIKFASSSVIKSVTRISAYYTDKNGKQKNVTFPTAAFSSGVLNGGIKVNSNVTDERLANVIIHMTFEVENTQGIKETFTVTQYPSTYIQGVLSYFSYRTDFQDTDYLSYGTGGRVGADWSNNKWDYKTTAPSNDYHMFQSKVVVNDNGSSSTLGLYKWSKQNNKYSVGNGRTISGNPRMYHITITSTDSKYNIGKPKLDANGYTASDAANNQLVSPSFMIASSLGAVLQFNSEEAAKQHCSYYAEAHYITDKDGKQVLRRHEDWRLPTEAEISIIVKYQNNSEAMDQLITGEKYYCASGSVKTGISGAQSGTYLRCVRDAYTNSDN